MMKRLLRKFDEGWTNEEIKKNDEMSTCLHVSVMSDNGDKSRESSKEDIDKGIGQPIERNDGLLKGWTSC